MAKKAKDRAVKALAGGKRASKRPQASAPRAKRSAAKVQRRMIHVLSDSTGNLARHMLTAFLTQFAKDSFVVRVRTFLQSQEKVERAVGEAVAERGIVFHAILARAHKRLIEERCAASETPCRDMTGDFVQFIERESGLKPLEDARRLHSMDSAYRQRIRALEFAMEHDDGLGLETLHEADIVLCGVSRTSKTPTSVYLAQQGYRVGNVALAMQVEVPKELLALTGKRVVGLIIDPSTLTEIRTRRQTEWRMSDTNYNDRERVEEEIRWSRRLFASRGWPVLNVTDQAIEETAGRIVNVLGLGAQVEGEETT